MPIRSFFALALVATLLPIALDQAPAGADDPVITLEKSTPGRVLYGTDADVSLTATNTSAHWGYNLSFRDVLPTGISYVAGSSSPDPVILADKPALGQTTLIWTNVADVSPNSSFSFGYQVRHTTSANPAASCATAALWCVGETYTNAASAYVNGNPRYVPDFDVNGQAVPGATSYTATAADAADTTLVPFVLSKDEPNTEGEILRGVHDHVTTYTLTVDNNLVAPTNGFVIDDWLPAGLEFLGCGGIDNTGINSGKAPTNPTSTLEYPGAPDLTGTPVIPSCLAPTLVETVSVDPDGADGPLTTDVYTHVQWSGLGNLSAGGQRVITYQAAIPIRENTLAFTGVTTAPNTTGEQTANLANNSGAETVDEQDLTNHALATGSYQGPKAAGVPPTQTDEADLSRTAEDLSIHKSGGIAIEQGEIVEWSMLLESSEYRFVEDIVVTDTLPDGLCPLDETTAFDTTNNPRDECHGSSIGGDQDPTLPFTSTTEQTDGRWSLVWDNVPDLGHSDSYTITYFTQVRDYYQQATADATPVLGRDGWSNEVAVVGNDYVVCANGDFECAAAPNSEPKIAADEEDGTPDLDASSAGQEAGYATIAKLVSAPVAEPLALGCSAATWLDQTDVAYPPRFKPGDRVCYRLTVSFPGGTDYRDAAVTDFIPANSSYEAGSAVALPANTVPLTTTEPAVDGDRLDWVFGVNPGESSCDPDVGSCYVTTPPSGATFDVAFATIVTGDPGQNSNADIIDNLMKFSSLNTAGTAVPLRDQIAYELAEPVLTIDKSVTGPTTGLRQGDVVPYTVTVTNTGLANAWNTEVWDVLPAEITCTDVSAITGGGTCNAGADRIEWTIAGPIDPAGSVLRTYSVTIPDETTDHPAAAGDVLTNTAGVRIYQTKGNRTAGDDLTDYVPANNIDTTLTSTNAPEAKDTQTVSVVAATSGKLQSTLTAQPGNADDVVPSPNRDQATIGETVEYTISVTVPAETTIYSGVFSDPLSGRLTYVPSSATITFPSGTSYAEGAVLPAGFTYGPVALTFPARYDNPIGDDTFTITFRATVDDEGTNTRTAGNLNNQARLTSTDTNGAAVPVVLSPQTQVQVVEPVLSITKVNDATTAVAGGQTIHYTVTVTNSSAARVSTANDLVVVDTLPAGLTTGGATGITEGGVYAAGPPQKVTWTLGTLDPGASRILEYDVVVSDAVIASKTYTNAVTATATSMPGSPTDERSYSVSTSSDVDVVDPALTKTVSPGVRTIGEMSTFTLIATIPANTELFDATLIDDLPVGLTFEAFGTPTCVEDGGACAGLTVPTTGMSPSGQRLAWFIGDVTAQPHDRVLTFTVDAFVASTAGAGDSLVNGADLFWNTSDVISGTPVTIPDPADFADRAGEVNAPVAVTEPSLDIDKDVAGQVGDTDTRLTDVDETLTYTVRVSNRSGATSSAAHDVTVVDTVPDGLVVQEASITGGGVLAAGTPQTITWTVSGPISAGGFVEWTYDAVVGDSAAFGTVTALANTAEVTAYFGVSQSDREAAPSAREFATYAGPEDTVTVDPDAPAISVDKSHTGDAVVGEAFEWTIEVTNEATVASAVGIDLADTLPSSWTYTGPSQLTLPGGSPAPVVPTSTTPLVWTDLGDLEPGESLTVTFLATPGFAARDNSNHENTVDATTSDADGNDGNLDGDYADSDTDEPTLTGATLGDRVWEDLNGNGVQDPSEPGIVGADVRLIGAGLDGTFGTLDDVVLDTTATGPGGAYRFDVLPAGDYQVAFDEPAGFTPTAVDLTGDDAADSDLTPSTGRSGTVTLGSGEEDLTVDAGFYQPVQLGDVVWDDLNGNGQRDGGEPGVDGVTVTLSGAGPDGTFGTGDDLEPRTTTTASGGAYLFEDLAPGRYVVAFDTTTATGDTTYLFTVPDTGDDLTDSDAVGDLDTPTTGITGTVELTSGSDDLTVDAGLIIPASIGDRVWFDADGDGLQGDPAAEPGLPGIEVTLVDLGADGAFGGGDDITIETTTTGPGGAYLFQGLEPATYGVVFTTPDGYELTDQDAGDDDLDSDADPTSGRSSPIDLPSGGEIRTIDAGVLGLGRLGDRIWEDLDDDGVQDALEPGIGGAIVTLTWIGPDGDVVIGSVTTSDDGLYAFDRLPPGDFTVDVTVPAVGLVPTFDPDDPSAPVTTPGTAEATLDPGQERLDLDFGYQRQADLELVKIVDDPDLIAGDTATFRIDVRNDGPAPAAGPIVVTDTLPAGLTPTSAAGADWTCDPITGQAVVCTYGGSLDPLAVGGSLPELVVEATVDLDAGLTETNTATVVGMTVDPDLDDNTGSADVSVTPAADLAITKTHSPDGFTVGRPAAWTIQVTNQGPLVDPGPITVTDEVPAFFEIAEVVGDGWTCAVDGQAVTCERTDPLPVGPAAPITVAVTPRPGSEGEVVNSASVGSPLFDPDPTDDEASDAAEVAPVIGLTLEKALQGPLVAGGEAVYLLTVGNEGPSVANGVTVTDELPAGLGYLRSEGAGWSCGAVGRTVRCALDEPLAVGTSSDVRIVTRVEAVAGMSITNVASVVGEGIDLGAADGPVSASSGSAVVTSAAPLVRTGGEVAGLLRLGALLMLFGTAGVLTSRRQRRPSAG